MNPKQELIRAIRYWIGSFRPDMYEGKSYDIELEEALYKMAVNELINDSSVSFKSEEEILSSNISSVASYMRQILSQNYYSLYSMIDSVWEEHYDEHYSIIGELIRPDLIQELMAYFETIGITIDNIVEEEVVNKFSYNKSESIENRLLNEEQFRLFTEIELCKAINIWFGK